MTLVLSEVSKYGIVMVGDSAITSTHPSDQKLPSGKAIPSYTRTGCDKVKLVPQRPIGISFWGMGKIGFVPTDIWIDDFLENKITPEMKIDDLCNLLAQELNIDMHDSQRDEPGGFHIGAILGTNAPEPLPILYHVHKGHEGEPRGPFKLYEDYPFGQGIDIETYRQNLERGILYYLRNGVHQYFSNLQSNLINSIHDLGIKHNIHIPHPPGIEAQEKFVRLQLGLLSDLIAISDHLAVVGRPFSSLRIALNGTSHYTSALADITPL